MPLLVDTGVLYALADRRDAWHRRSVDYLKASPQSLFLPATVLPEVSYLLRERIGVQAERAFVASLANGEIAVEEIQPRDWARVHELLKVYPFLGLVDASILTIVERLKVTTLATTDRRHFGAVRLAHVDALTLVP